MPTERRNLTALGRKRRREFDRSAQKLRDLGMPDWAIEYYRRASRIAGLPPHMVVCHVAVVAAGRQMQANLAHEHVADAADEAICGESGGVTALAAPSYEAVQTLRRRVTGLWHEIQRHADLRAEGFAPGTVTPLRAKAPAPDATGTRTRRR
jgi:hypothetical protein